MRQGNRQKLGWATGLAICGTLAQLFVDIAAFPVPALAQVVADPSLGTTVTPNGTTYDITGGTTVGSRNLFHSFGRFDVQFGETANFLNAPTIANIFARITGGTASNINGLIQAQGTANLFLMNPSGILFGSGAQLNIGGSFVATTANAIQFPGGAEFSLTSPVTPTNPLLTVNPSAFLFNQLKAASIQSNSANLEAEDGQSLVLLGGDVTLDDSLLNLENVLGGRAELGGLAAPGKVDLAVDGGIFRLSFPKDVLRSDVILRDGSGVNVIAGSGGSIAVHARNLTVSNGSYLLAGVGSGGAPNSQAGDITLDATEIIEVTRTSFIENGVYRNEIGNSGNIYVTAGSLSITGGAYLATFVLGQGQAGDVVIKSGDRVAVKGTSPDGQFLSGVFSVLLQGATGDAGDLTIDTKYLIVRDGAQVTATTFGRGNAGSLTVRASDSVELSGERSTVNGEVGFPGGLFAQVDLTGTGRGGNLTIETRRLSVSNGSKVQVATFGDGDAGNLFIRADEIDVFATRPTRFTTAINAGVTRDPRTVTPPKGKGGTLTIETGRLSVWNTPEATRLVEVTVNTAGVGNAGTLLLQARDSVEVTGNLSSISARVLGQATGRGGDLFVQTNQLNLRDGGQISASSQGAGEAGNIFIQARHSVRLDNQSQIVAATRSGNGGNIILEAQDLVLLRRGSQISTTAGTAQVGGDGGNITINAPRGFIVGVQNENSAITANAFTGSGGRVTITAQGIYGLQFRPRLTPFSDITASSEFGISGTVTLNTPDVDPSRGLQALPVTLVDPSQQFSQECVPRGPKRASSFVITGRGGIASSPTEVLQDESVLADWVSLRDEGGGMKMEERGERGGSSSSSPPPPTSPSPHLRSADAQGSPLPPTPIVEAQGWIVEPDGTVVLVAELPTAAPHSPLFAPMGCPD
ncbi:MAG: S-layer family protein [Leptolyngbyaceae cyanobacterium RU_5_1]|nr:S-layer family protein [Leptolyngbyaceae cyanobacterium RU_5_1]